MSNFSDAVAKYASDQDCYGIIAGHIHTAEMKMLHGKHYVNCGCWTDLSNCNAIVEDEYGELQILNYGESQISLGEKIKTDSNEVDQIV